MSHPRLLLLLLLLLGAVTTSGRALSVSGSILGCLQAALSEPRNARPEDGAVLEKRGSESPREASQEDAEEELGKRTFPGDGHHGAAAPARGKGSQSRAKGDRRAKVTLSLDVPTNIMNILFNIAKAKNLRAKAAANAHLMAQIGRRK